MTDAPDDDGLVERVARIIDPTSFRYHESMFSYCLAQGDDDSTAERYADETHGASMETAREIAREAIASMPIAALRAENEALRAERDDLRDSVIAFGAPWAVAYAKDFGLAEGELHPTHYDILANAGAHMVDFKRADIGASHEPG